MIVLYVDDDSDDREIFGGAIHAVNPSVKYTEFEAGEKLIDFLGREKVKPDYVFVDINMPKMNGYECAQALISVYGTECSRIVMYSTYFNTRDIERFKQMGVKMLQKAGSFDQLIQNLKNLFALNQLEQLADRENQSKPGTGIGDASSINYSTMLLNNLF